jgi:hypothetical protein
MTYRKPEVKTLGEATAVIQNPLTKAAPNFGDGVKPHIVTPAYDLDE